VAFSLRLVHGRVCLHYVIDILMPRKRGGHSIIAAAVKLKPVSPNRIRPKSYKSETQQREDGSLINAALST